ncbi:enoyl-CoA hydratase/isomerase family protein [Pseudomonas citronellolis]|uniref:enoyl-CoA hydratase/isomerase family protein n=1 Tax=Pseudomonas citronellolis TaxID=53408 RepID=UPI0021BF65D2|nr:enoyl-CoA hydratase-related protein [Pseudomonas citronellolis]UXJ50218.1 enoyl-CoA hydratase-related protein [Pseudomonas citronellolis]
MSEHTDIVQVEHRDEVAIVTMNYPERRNAFSLKMRLALLDVFHRLLHEDTQSRAIVLTGAGGHFCAGGDLSEMTQVSSSLLEMRERIAIGTRLFRLLFTGDKPIVAAIEGSCMGAGVSLAAACDLVIGSETAKLSCAFVKVGLLPDTGVLWTLPQKVGGGKARELMLSGASFDGAEAARIGLFNQVVAPGHALEAAVERAARLAQLPPVTLALLKASLVHGGNGIDAAWRREVDLNPLTRQTQDHQEAVAAFLEKRKPTFSGN